MIDSKAQKSGQEYFTRLQVAEVVTPEPPAPSNDQEQSHPESIDWREPLCVVNGGWKAPFVGYLRITPTRERHMKLKNFVGAQWYVDYQDPVGSREIPAPLPHSST